MHPDALLIDAMGTLLALEDPVTALDRELRKRFGLALPAERRRAALGAEIAHYRAHMLQGRDGPGLAALHRDCAAVLRAGLGVAVAGDEMTELLLAALRFTAYPDAREALLAVRAAGARVIVVSNWDISLADVLQRSGLAPLLDGVLTSAALGAAKPAREMFAAACALAGVPAERCLHVGDSPAEDVAGARAAGVAAVLLARTGGAPPPGLDADVPVITSLSELRFDLTSPR